MNTKYVGIILYDFPMQSQEDILEYRSFRKSIIGKGYYQLQESVYIVNSDTKEHIETIEKEVSIIASSRASIRSLILTEEQFKRKYVKKEGNNSRKFICRPGHPRLRLRSEGAAEAAPEALQSVYNFPVSFFLLF